MCVSFVLLLSIVSTRLSITIHSQADREKKRADQLEKKATAKKLLEEEEEKLGGKSLSASAGATKVTRVQIAEAQAREKAAAAAAAAKPLPKGVSEPIFLEENPNRVMQQRAAEGHLDARTVEEAIAVLDISSGGVVERHPERRMKAAYAAFEERELSRLKAKNPNLRLSQLKQLLKKEWMKSPENPMNQVHVGIKT